MPGQLLPLRLLRSAKSGRSFLAFLMNRRCPDNSGLRRFSSQSFRPRGGGGGRGGGRGGSESFGSRTLPRRGEFQTGSLSGRGGGPKSLIEDEAELSDWVGDLKTSSIRLGLTSESEDSDRESGRGRVGGRRGGREDLSSSKRRRDDGFNDFQGGSNGGRSSRTLTSMGSKKFYNAFEEDEDDDDEEAFGSKRRQAGSRSRGGLSSRGGRYTDSKFGHRREGGDSMRGGKASGRQARQIVDSDDDEDDIDGISGFGDSEVEETDSDTEPLKGGASKRGSSKFEHRREGRDSMRGVKASGRQARQIVDSDDDEDDVDGNSGFGDSEVEETDSDTELFKGGASKTELGASDRKEISSKSSTGKSDSYLSDTRFDQCSISSLSLKGIKEAGYERMTVVQEVTLPVILKGKDVLAKAKTGTGKTVAFLLPAIEVIVKLSPPDRDNKRPPINVLIVCPTRELATQAATEANKLLKFHPSLGVQVVIGGTRLALEQKRMQANPCQILVATPGRLKDHIENTPGFASRLMGIKVLVLDEADHLLDMGFRRDIEKIVAAVPKQRQTLLFSATVPDEVQQICHIALKRDYEFINTVEEGSEETHSQVKQMHLVAPLDEHFSLLYSILKEHIGEDADYKVLVFCTTAMVTKLVSELLSELKLNVREIHSRKPQSYRTRVSDEFRKSKGLILVTSDVSARGVDYPDVTLVVQVGLPSEREQYIHRLGRTGRKGKEGRGILLLAPWEEFFLSSIRDLPITKAPIPPVDPDTRKKMKNKESAYQAWLGYYNSSKNVGRDKVRLVQLANEFSRSMGLDNPPAIPRLVLGKMGLKNVPGLRSK